MSTHGTRTGTDNGDPDGFRTAVQGGRMRSMGPFTPEAGCGAPGRSRSEGHELLCTPGHHGAGPPTRGTQIATRPRMSTECPRR